jgi:hypothetical protein
MASGSPTVATLIRVLAGALAAVLTVRFVPATFCARNANRLFDGDHVAAGKAMRGAGRQIAAPIELARFGTGSTRFDAEWRFITYVSTAYAAAQVAAEHESEGTDARLILRTSVERALSPDARVYDTNAWGEDAIATLDSNESAHGGLIGYLCLALALEGRIAPVAEHVVLENRLRATIANRLKLAKSGLINTYPSEAYPADNAPGAACLTFGSKDDLAVARAFESRLAADYVDDASGLLVQRVSGTGVDVHGQGRASGSAFAAYFLGFSGAPIALDLHRALQRQTTNILGFAGVQEYRGKGRSDVDSGALIFGMSPSATAFTLGSARAQGDRQTFRAIYASNQLFGMPVDNANSRNTVVGGPVADAIIAAMVTARTAGAWLQPHPAGTR